MVPALNTLRPRQNGRHFADTIFQCIFLNEKALISLKISQKFIPMVRINNIPALVQIMALHRPGDKPLYEPWLVYWRIYASLGLNDLTRQAMIISSTNISWIWVSYVMSHERYGTSNHQQFNCLPNRLSRAASKTTSKLGITGPLWGESTSDWWIPLTKGQ